MNIRWIPVLAGAVAVAAVLWTPGAAASAHAHHNATGLIAAAHDATGQYRNLAEAEADGYALLLGCVTGPDHGAMGVHYVNQGLVGDGVLDAQHPEALVYEPTGNGGLRLVAVEYVTIASVWDAAHPESTPVLMGQLFDYVGAPNRFGLPAFYALHVWAWAHNPLGAFTMWNPHVSCNKYTAS
ncbi:MAG TPA: hypothetical protein VFK96_07705 [Gammaproteobacteria bacterium]|nr:hypothetical protein [Gammaproteobacteria bacterium]